MFLWNLEKCKQLFNTVYVSSDSDEILETARKNGAIAIKRPKNLCGETPDIDVYKHALGTIPDDCLVAVHANNPTIEPKIINSVRVLMTIGAEEVMTCYPMSHNNNYHEQSNKIYGSVRGLTRDRIENYPDPYKPDPDFLVVDESIEIETKEDYEKCLAQ